MAKSQENCIFRIHNFIFCNNIVIKDIVTMTLITFFNNSNYASNINSNNNSNSNSNSNSNTILYTVLLLTSDVSEEKKPFKFV